MTTSTLSGTSTVTLSRGRKAALLIAALAFTLLYLSVDLVGAPLASTELPLPNDPVADTRAWFDANALAATVMALLHALSVTALLVFTATLHGSATTEAQRTAVDRARPWAWLAVGLIYLASVCNLVLAAVASDASLDAVSVLRSANFIAGGTAHVLALGLFVWFAAQAPWFGRSHRILAWVVLISGVLSISSIVVFQGGVFVLLGRLLGMIWTIAAATALIRGRRW
jgi:hypothetical protein